MAMTTCKECGKDVSDAAVTCPHCGIVLINQPASQSRNKGCSASALFGAAILMFFFALLLSTCSDSNNSSLNSTKKESCKPDDLICIGSKGVIGASIYCKRAVENMAKHNVKWTDETFEQKFSRFRWKNMGTGEITYIGDRAEFQNGFGAYTPVIYECDMAQDNKTVLDVRVSEGRLPQ